MKKPVTQRRVLRIAIAVWTVLIAALLAQTAFADENEWRSTLFSYDFESDQIGDPPTINASNPLAWSASASNAESTLTVIAEAGGQVLQYERVSSATGSGGPRLDKQVNLEESTLVSVEFRIRTEGNRFDLDVRSSSASSAESTRMLTLNGAGLITNPPTGASFSGSEYVHVAAVIDKTTATYSVYLDDVQVKADEALHSALDLSGTAVFRFSAVLTPDNRVFIDDVMIRSDAPGTFLEELSPEHPRLIATNDDFAALRSRILSDSVSAGWYNQLLTRAETILTQPVSHYHFPDGRTLRNVSREVLDRTYVLATVYQVEEDTRFAERLWNELNAAAAFPDWNPQSFLSTAEMTHAFAIGYDWLYDYWSGARRETISDAIVSLGLHPGLAAYNNGEPWTTTTNNWNIVTNSGLGIGALAVGDLVPELAEEIITRGIGNMPNALHEYAPDGAYPEGVGYWAYATRYLVPYIAALETALNNDFGLRETVGLENTGYYPLYVAGPSGKSFNYYDSSDDWQQPPELLWLGKAYDEPVFSWWAGQVTRGTPRHLLWYDPAALETPEEAELPLDKYFGGSELVLSRSDWNSPDAVFTGFKAGFNGTNHGDLDLGTFVLDALGVRWAEDFGTDDYGLPGYMSDGVDGQRWTYYRKRAEGHNTLVVNPGYAADQYERAAGEIVQFEQGPTETFSVADLTDAYAHRGVTNWQRGIKLFDHRRQVLVQDELQANAPVDAWWFMHTRAEIDIAVDGKSAILSQGGEKLLARIVSPSSGVSFLAMDAAPLWSSPQPEGQTVNQGVRKLAISIEQTSLLQLAVLFTPLLGDEEPDGPLPAIVPLQNWSVAHQTVPELAGLSLDGIPLEGFVPHVFTYDIRLEGGGDPLPIVTATAEDPLDVVTVQQADDSPGKAIVTVQRPSAPQTRYEVRFHGEVREDDDRVSASIVGTYPPNHTIDGKLETFFSAQGVGQWVQYHLDEPLSVNGVRLAWYQGNARAFNFKVLGSMDGDNWTELYSGTSAGNTLALEEHNFTAATASYVRIVGYGNSVNQWMSLTEARILHQGGVWPNADPIELHPVRLFLQADEDIINIGDSVQLTASASYNDGSSAGTAASNLLFISSNEAVAEVDASGEVSGIDEGTVRLSAVLFTEDRRVLHTTVELTVIDSSKLRVSPSNDAFVRGGTYADDNYGSTQTMTIKQDNNVNFRREAYMTFNIPVAAEQIESAVLYLYGGVNSGEEVLEEDQSVEIHEVDLADTWVETTITWNTRPTVLGYVTSIPVNEVRKWGAADITSLVLDQLDEGSLISLALLHEAPSGNRFTVQINSRQHSTLSPYLELQLKPEEE